MLLQLDLPERDYTHRAYEADGSLAANPNCRHCDEELDGTAVKVQGIGWIHADPCLAEIAAKLTADPEQAWRTVARTVADSPSKYTASTVRAVITQLLK